MSRIVLSLLGIAALDLTAAVANAASFGGPVRRLIDALHDEVFVRLEL